MCFWFRSVKHFCTCITRISVNLFASSFHDYNVKFPNLKFNLGGNLKTTEKERELTF